MPDHDSTTSLEPRQGRFATTHWNTVLTASRESAPEAEQALEKLCSTCWQPLYSYVRRKGYAAADAQDLTQQFFFHLLQGKRLAFADPARGRFRTFLLSALNHFLINEWIKLRREKRGGGIDFVPLHAEHAESVYSAEPVEHCAAEALYELRWAALLIRRSFDRLEGEHVGNRMGLFEALKPYVWGDKTTASQAELAATLGLSCGAVRVAIHRLRQRFREILREEIAQTVASPEEVDDELRYLVEVVSRGPM